MCREFYNLAGYIVASNKDGEGQLNIKNKTKNECRTANEWEKRRKKKKGEVKEKITYRSVTIAKKSHC